MIYDHTNDFHDSIIGQTVEGNLTVLDILNYLQNILNSIINITYDKILFLFLQLYHQMQITHIYT